jgi:biotin operon repressor
MSAKQRILEVLRKNVTRLVPTATIIAAAKSSEWARRVRELRAEGWVISHVKGGYILGKIEKLPSKDVLPISEKLRYAVLRRDDRCRRCGRGVEDGVTLVVDHITPRAWGGETVLSNLWALCESCNRGKKHFESDADASVMRRVLSESSGRARVLAYLKMKVGDVVTMQELNVVARIQDYPRRIRELRDEGWDIISHLDDPKLKSGQYVLRSLQKKATNA